MQPVLTAVAEGQGSEQKRDGEKAHDSLLLPIRRRDATVGLVDVVPVSLDEVADQHNQGRRGGHNSDVDPEREALGTADVKALRRGDD
jgi:hypothetical protein